MWDSRRLINHIYNGRFFVCLSIKVYHVHLMDNREITNRDKVSRCSAGLCAYQRYKWLISPYCIAKLLGQGQAILKFHVNLSSTWFYIIHLTAVKTQKLRLFEILVWYDGIVWALQMVSGRIRHQSPSAVLIQCCRTMLGTQTAKLKPNNPFCMKNLVSYIFGFAYLLTASLRFAKDG